MNRRSFLALSTATLATTALAPSLAQASLIYSEGLVQKHLAAGDTVFLGFHASWCSTCAVQEGIIEGLRKDNPAYDSNIVFINVDWDDYRRSDLVKSLGIPRRSTLVALKGDQDLGRIVAGTAQSQIKSLLDKALNAATA